MSIITDESPPSSTDADLAEYLTRMFRDAKLSDDQSDQFLVRYRYPTKLSVAKVYYFGAAIAATAITGEGLWLYKSTGWVQIA